ncbi:MAG: superoxide dismutase [Flavobacteriia bacterium]|nr:superoxide dismutase [Flavobacteriia bacterium]
MKLLFIIIFLLPLYFKAQYFELPKLNYSYQALEPYIDAQTMEIHYSKHHAAYVNNLNQSLGKIDQGKISLIDILLKISTKSIAVRNNAGGHYNHSMFWEILNPVIKYKNIRIEELERAIKEDLGNIDSLKSKMNRAASTRFGSGWAWLYVDTDKKLKICSTPNQDNPFMDINPDRGIPILGIDVWEHAYYLKYQNKRSDYLNSIWKLINWEVVSENYIKAIKSPLLAYIEKDSWKPYKEFSILFDQINEEVQKNDFSLLKNKSSELAMNALNLKQSVIPKPFPLDETKKLLDEILKHCNELHKMVNKNTKSDLLNDKLKLIQSLKDKIY